MALLLKGGLVIDPGSGIDMTADVLITGDRIAEVGPELKANGAEVIDVTGKVVTPGFIDLHVHLRDPGLTEKETIRTGTMSAAAGGFTTIVAMPNTRPVCDNPEVMRYVAGSAEACVHVLPAAAITRGSEGKELTDFAALKKAGAVILTDDGETVMDARVMREAMLQAAALDLVIMPHCEDKNLSQGTVMHEGKTARALGYRGMPASAESVMVARDVLLAAETGCRLHLTHVSTKEAAEIIRLAKRQGVRVTADVTPHNFSLTDEAVATFGANAKMYPPLRSAEDVEAMCQGLADGTIDAIATDHAPHTVEEKKAGMDRAPKGVVGLETALGVALTYLVGTGRLSLRDLVARFTVIPATILGLAGGTLRPGSIADVTVFDPDCEWTVRACDFFSKGRNTPFEGSRLKGKPYLTIVAGTIKMQAGEIIC